MSRVGASWRWRGGALPFGAQQQFLGQEAQSHRVAAAAAQRSKTSVEEGRQEAADNMADRALASLGRAVLGNTFLPVDCSRAPCRGAARDRLAFEGLHHHHHCKEKRNQAESTEN